MELTFDVQNILVFMLSIIFNPLPGISGLIIVDTNVTSCDGIAANISFNVDLQTGSIITNTESWYYGTTVIATKSGGVFSPVGNYISRLHSYSSYGLTLDNVTDTDKGRYEFRFSYLSPLPEGSKTATAALIVKVTPSEICVPRYRQEGASAICELDSAANCGSPRLVPIWTNLSGNNFTVINPGNYTCCATGSILTDCYRGSNSFCQTFNVTVTSKENPASSSSSTTVTTSGTSATTTTTGKSTSHSTFVSSSTYTVPNDNTSMKPTTTGQADSTFKLISSTTVLLANVTSNISTVPGSTSINPTTVLPTNVTSNISTVPGSTSINPTTVLPPNVTSNISIVPGSTSINPTTVLPPNVANKTTLSATTSNTNSNRAKSKVGDSDIKVIVPAVVVPCGLLIIGAIILLVVLCARRRVGKNVHKSPDDIVIQNKDKKKDRWKQSIGHGKVTNNHGEYITPDGFIIYPVPAARSNARSYKDKKFHGVTDQYSRPDSWTYHHQAGYTPNTFTSTYTRKGKHPVTDQYSRPDSWTYHHQAGYTPNTFTSTYTHKGKHPVTDQYSRPYREVYGYQTAYLPSTHKSARTYEQRAKNYDIEGHQQASHPMATSRLAYGQTMYYPQTGYYGQSSHDAYYRGDGQYSYGQMSRPHHDYKGQKQQSDYYSQYQMTDYRHDKIGDMHTKQDTSFYY